jgi:hypothetical protein
VIGQGRRDWTDWENIWNSGQKRLAGRNIALYRCTLCTVYKKLRICILLTLLAEGGLRHQKPDYNLHVFILFLFLFFLRPSDPRRT